MLSKKLIAFTFAEITWKALLLTLILMKSPYLLVLGTAIVVVSGFIEAYYIGGVAAIDKYLKIAEIVTKTGSKMTTKDMTVEGKKIVDNSADNG